MPVTDYAKWEKMDLSDMEEENRARKPRLTRLEGPSRITIGAPEAPVPDSGPVPHTSGRQTSHDALDYSKWDKMVDDEDEGESDDETSMDVRAQSVASAPAAPTSSSSFGYSYPASTGMAADAFEEDALDPQEEERLREVLATSTISAPPPCAISPEERLSALSARLSRNGAVRESHLWRQSADEVEISVLVPPGTRAKQVRPKLIPSAEPASSPTLLVERTDAAGSSPPYFRGVLAYPVEVPDEAGELSWEITDYEPEALGGRRVVRVNLRKPPMQGLVVWWTRALQIEPEIDTLSLPDRKRVTGAEEMQSVWEQAQVMFREKVASLQPREVTLGGAPWGEASEAEESQGPPRASVDGAMEPP
jgi:hypothetical protein